MATQTYTGTLVIIECYKCGIAFGVPKEFNRECREEGENKAFYCPNGHGQSYTTSETQQLRQQLADKQAAYDREQKRVRELREMNDHLERRVAATRGVVTKLKNRTQRGLCPVCDQHFPSLKTHMATLHPDFEETTEQ